MQAIKQKVAARYLMAGDQTGSGEMVIAASRGARPPSGKLEVTLEKNGRRRNPLWGASTLINISRPDNSGQVAVKVETLRLILSDLAALALSPDCAAGLAAHDAALTSNLATLQLICSTCVAEPRREVSTIR
jgi:hypothetical protein